METQDRALEEGEPRIGPWLSEAFDLFGKEWRVWLFHGLVVLLATTAVFGAVAFALAAAGLGRVQSLRVEGVLRVSAWAAAWASLPTALVMSYLAGGMVRTAGKQLRGEPLRFTDLFLPPRLVGPALAAYLLWSLLQLVALAACCVPWFVVAALFMYAPAIVIDRGAGPLAALAESQRAVRRHLGLQVVWLLLTVLISSAGSILLCGTVATVPIAALMLMVAYRDTFGLGGRMPPSEGGGVPAPIGGAPVPTLSAAERPPQDPQPPRGALEP